jgi:uncharacterized protein YigE (DUF2233 family)
MKHKNIRLYRLCYLLLAFSFACHEEEDGKLQITAEPKTEAGAKLVEKTGLIASIFSDSSYTPTPGLTATELFYFSMKGYAMHLFVFEVDLANPAIHLEVARPVAPSDPLGLQTVREQAEHEDAPGHQVWGAINGSFFNVTTGVSYGLFYNNGTQLQLPSAAYPNFFAITTNKKAVIGNEATYNSIKPDVYEAIGGGVLLVNNNVMVTQTETVPSVNPRTCIGISADQTRVYIMAVDGRKYHYSNGMTYEELSKCMMALGAKDALNLDGGGSTSFLVRNTSDVTPGRFQLRNWPSENGGVERPVSNSLVIVSN